MLLDDFNDSSASESFQWLGLRVFAASLRQVQRVAEYVNDGFQDGPSGASPRPTGWVPKTRGWWVLGDGPSGASPRPTGWCREPDGWWVLGDGPSGVSPRPTGWVPGTGWLV